MTRFDKKVDRIVWTIILLLPIIVFVVSTFRNPSLSAFSEVVSKFKFGYISEIMNKIFIDNYVLPTDLVNYLSYFCVVEISHVFVDFICFIPRFAHNFLGGLYAREK